MPENPSALTRPGDAEIADAKRYLDLMRASGDTLKTDLAEAVLNNLLDRYHRYHVSQSEEQ